MEIARQRQLLRLRCAKGGDAGDLQRQPQAQSAEMARELNDRSWCNGEAYTLADIAVGCAFGYLDLRYTEFDWRDAYRGLAKLSERLAKRVSFSDTKPPAG